MNPNLIAALLTVVILLATAATGWALGAKSARDEAKAEQLEAVAQAIAQANAQAIEDAEIIQAASQKAEATQVKTRIIIKEVVRHVQDKPVYTDCQLDPIGLCLAQSAARGESGEGCTRGADAALPSPASSRSCPHGRAAGELHRNRHAPARLPGYARGVDCLG